MNDTFPAIVALSAALTVSGLRAGQAPPLVLVGWGIDAKAPDAFLARAEATGFQVLIAWSTDREFLGRAVEAGGRHNIRVFACISPMGGLANLWTRRYPERPVPWQVMTEAENAARSFLMAGRNKYIIPYQFGGEPTMANEVLETRIVCLRNPSARELLRLQIDGIAAVPGLEGLAFDGFGYQNYRRCHCEDCVAAFAAYRREHPDMADDAAEVTFFRDALVECIQDLANYARSRREDLRTTIHIWPVFQPEPLYGNRLDVDFCGQTAAWYTLWPQDKIARYSQVIAAEARRYYPRPQGVGMIGYYDRPGEFPVKDAARVDLELRTMIENGCRRIQVCGARDVMDNESVAAVFRKYFR
ncbi:MAG: hypothetical protein JXR77_07045 [Lentisphaeria bacterium]|nr:hypothetical protein [Lentisphaeria bacterium]